MTTVEILRSAEYPIWHKFKNPYTPYASRTGYLFGLYGDNRTRSALHYGFAEAKFLQDKNERSLERTKISGTVTTVDTTNVDILNFLCYT